MTARFDIFLSHSLSDALAVEGLKNILEADGLAVYVDWIVDPQLERSAVSVQTAETLRRRMRQSSSLIYATSAASVQSKWMPWELGYFGGHKPNRVAVVPLVESIGGQFPLQEYVELYPFFELRDGPGSRLAIKLAGGRSSDAREFIASGVFRNSGL